MHSKSWKSLRLRCWYPLRPYQIVALNSARKGPRTSRAKEKFTKKILSYHRQSLKSQNRTNSETASASWQISSKIRKWVKVERVTWTDERCSLVDDRMAWGDKMKAFELLKVLIHEKQLKLSRIEDSEDCLPSDGKTVLDRCGEDWRSTRWERSLVLLC